MDGSCNLDMLTWGIANAIVFTCLSAIKQLVETYSTIGKMDILTPNKVYNLATDLLLASGMINSMGPFCPKINKKVLSFARG